MKPTKVFRRKVCRLCESTHMSKVVSLHPTPAADKYLNAVEKDTPVATYPLDLWICRDCGHVQLLDILDPEFLFDNDYAYLSGGTKALVEHFGQIARYVCEQYGVPPGSQVIDIGSNDGSLLRSFKDCGAKVLGIEPVYHIAERAIAAGVPTLNHFLTPDLAQQIRRERGETTVVCAFNVYAHVDDLSGMTESIRQLLGPRGVFVFEVSYLLDVIQRMLLGTIFHEHLSYHSMKAMRQFLRRHGLELVETIRNNIQGGSVIGIAQLARGPHRIHPSVDQLIRLEDEFGLDQHQTFEKFATDLHRLRERVQELFTRIRAEGKTVWGYGAARSGTTLIVEMELKDIRYIVDDSPDKQNKFSPLMRIPIRPSAALLQEQPDYVIILAWIHADRIIEKNQDYLKRGGKFIVCVPDIRIVGAENVVSK